LYGVGFDYQREFDERILVAISKLVLSHKSIIAVFKYKGSLKVYTVVPLDLNAMRLRGYLYDDRSQRFLQVCGDLWYIEQYVPCENDWVEPNKLIDSL
jgi:hypothetical protein